MPLRASKGLAGTHRVEPVDVGDVIAGPAVDDVADAVARAHAVPPGAAVEPIATGAAVEEVVAGTAVEYVVASATEEHVVAAATVDEVGADRPDEPVSTGGAGARLSWLGGGRRRRHRHAGIGVASPSAAGG